MTLGLGSHVLLCTLPSGCAHAQRGAPSEAEVTDPAGEFGGPGPHSPGSEGVREEGQLCQGHSDSREKSWLGQARRKGEASQVHADVRAQPSRTIAPGNKGCRSFYYRQLPGSPSWPAHCPPAVSS